MDIKQINSAIMFGNFTNEELNSIVSAINYNRAQLARQTRRSLRVGSKVQFFNRRNNQTYTGTVERVKIKNVLVATPQGRWNVPANMLEVL